MYSHGGQHALLYTNGPRKDHFHPGQGQTVSDTVPDDNFTVIPSQGKNRYLSYDIDDTQLLPMRMHGPAAHPHAYPWHEGHTGHHGDEGLAKAVKGNDQAAGVGTPTFAPTVASFGTVTPGAKTNLNHYDFRSFEPQIDALAKKHGYQFKYMGGPHGMPDLGKENFNTGTIHILETLEAGQRQHLR